MAKKRLQGLMERDTIFFMLVDKGISVQKVQRLLDIGILIFFILTVLIPLGAFVHYVLLEQGEPKWNPWASSLLSGKKGGGKRGVLDEVLLENSFISLENKRLVSIPLPELSKQLVLLEHLFRPDLKNEGGVLLFGLEEGGQKRLIHPGEKVYLFCKNNLEIAFTNEKTPFWIESIIDEGHPIEVAFHVEFSGDEQDALYEEVVRFIPLVKKDLSQQTTLEKEVLQPIISYLSKVKILESDLLVEMYGGKAFENTKGSYRMYSGSQEAPFFIRTGELFVWKKDHLEEGKGDTRGMPLVMIRSLDAQKCELSIWDKEGVYNKLITIQLSKALPALAKPAELFLKLHQRTESSAICQLHDRNVILRKGDWLLYSKGKFKNLRTSDEVKDYLKYSLKGELFIFDGIIKREGVTLFAGSHFNEERTQVKKVEIPFSERKKSAPVKKKEVKVPVQQVKDE